MPIKLITTGGGSVILDANGTAANYTLTAPARTGNIITSADTGTVTQAMLASNIAGNGPSFGAIYSVNQTGISSGVFTKMAFNTKSWDTNSNYDATNYRFTATVAGYYLVNIGADSGLTSSPTRCIVALYKNGSMFRMGSNQTVSTTFGSGNAFVVNLAINDYIEFYVFISGTSPSVAASVATYVDATLIRSV